MLISCLWIAIGFVLLAVGADRLIAGAASIARHYRVAPLLIGITVLAIGTSLPEIVVSTYAAIYGNPDMALGNVIGSNIANIGLVLGLTILITPIRIPIYGLRRELPLLFIVMLFSSLLMLDGHLNRIDGLFLALATIVVLIWLVYGEKRSNQTTLFLQQKTEEPPARFLLAWFFIALGLALLPLGSHIVIDNAVRLAHHFGISDLLIGLTIIALGTSLPELATSIAGAYKKQYHLVAGNIIGSNIFNLLIALALPALIQPIKISTTVLTRDLPMMFGISIVLVLLLYFRRKTGELGRLEGLTLISLYVIYLVFLMFT